MHFSFLTGPKNLLDDVVFIINLIPSPRNPNNDHYKTYFVLLNGSSWWAFEGDSLYMMGTFRFQESHSRKGTRGWVLIEFTQRLHQSCCSLNFETSKKKSNKWWRPTTTTIYNQVPWHEVYYFLKENKNDINFAIIFPLLTS